MTRDITPIKWIIGAIALLIIVAGACYFWYQHSLANERKAAADALKLLRQREATQKTEDNEAKQAADGPVEGSTPTAEKPKSDAIALTDKTEPTQAQTGTAAPTAETQEMRVSPFGFGPYPEIPPDFPHQHIFDLTRSHPDYELMDRIWVELWKRGEKVEGMSTSNRTGLFYPTIPGTIYVEWGPRWKIAGLEIGRRIRAVKGSSKDLAAIRANRQTGHPLLESDIPAGIKVLEMSEGINPYTFLDLQK